MIVAHFMATWLFIRELLQATFYILQILKTNINLSKCISLRAEQSNHLDAVKVMYHLLCVYFTINFEAVNSRPKPINSDLVDLLEADNCSDILSVINWSKLNLNLQNYQSRLHPVLHNL